MCAGNAWPWASDLQYEGVASQLAVENRESKSALNITGNQAGPYAFTDAGVDYDTTYIVRAVIIAPDGTTKNCDTSVSTGAAPSCDAPTGLTVQVVQS